MDIPGLVAQSVERLVSSEQTGDRRSPGPIIAVADGSVGPLVWGQRVFDSPPRLATVSDAPTVGGSTQDGVQQPSGFDSRR